MLAMPGFLKVTCVLILVACMLAAVEVYVGQIGAAINTIIACIVFLAGMLALEPMTRCEQSLDRPEK